MSTSPRERLTGLTRPRQLLASLSALTVGLSVLAATPLAARAEESTGLTADVSADLEGRGDPAGDKELAGRAWPSADDGTAGSALAADDEFGSGYSVVDLTGNERSNASGINEAGEVSGTLFNEGGNFPFVWRDGSLVKLDAPVEQPSTVVRAMAIGDDGTVAGWQVSWKDNARFAVSWDKQSNGSYGPLQRLTKVWHGEDNAIIGGEGKAVSDNGAVLVTEPKESVTNVYADAVFDHGSARELAPIPLNENYGWMASYDMNNDDLVAGATLTGPSLYSAALWPSGSPSVLPSSPWSTPETSTQALAINDDKDVVVGVEGAGVRKMAIRRANGTWTDLGSLGSTSAFSNLEPWDINNKDVVVGSAWVTVDGVSTRHAFLWRDGKAIDLNAYLPNYTGWQLTAAHSINERGQIVGIGWHRGVETAFMLDPTAPLLFVPGAGASILKSFDDPGDPKEIWLGCSTPRIQLSLYPEDNAPKDVRAVDAARHMSCLGLGGSVVEDLDGYGTFLDAMTQRFGYREYQVAEKVERRTTVGCDTSQRDKAPNLFVFAYDWRKDNRLAAQQLEDYIGCIRKFFPDTDIDVVTHSMGSLVARRYVMNHMSDHHIHRMVTIGAPWLGSPKLVDVLNTGNFAPPIAAGEDVRHVVTGFKAAHELMAGPYYHRLMGPVFVEDGWNYDGRRTAHDAYDWQTLYDAFNARFANTRPAETAQTFQEEGGSAGQADWSQDTSGIPYLHVLGVRSGEDTIGQVVATEEVSCTPLVKLFCETKQLITQRMTRGDGTVPMRSASRIGPDGQDLNAPTSKLFPVIEEDADFDQGVEHTGLTRNDTVIRKVIATLRAPEDADTQGLAATPASADLDNLPAATPYRYVSVHGASDLVVHDGKGRNDAILGKDFRPSVPGVQHFAQGPDAELVTMPAEVAHDWRLTFAGVGEPLSLTALEGTQSDPTSAVHWRDVVVPDGNVAELRLTPTGAERLRVDTDGDGALDTTVAPTSDLSGADASDVDAPTVSVSATTVGGSRRYVVSGDDADGTGVRRLLWSTDGENFTPYAAPVDAGTATTLTAFAEDWAGNRSAMATLDLATAVVGPTTTASTDPAPSEQGWSAGPVGVTLTAQAGDSAQVQEVQVRSTGAQEQDVTVVDGTTATVTVTEPGRTNLYFRAVATDGTTEPWRQLTVRIDASAPAVRVVAPASGAGVGSLEQISGTAADDAAGVRSVEVTLQRTSTGSYWDGDSWESAPTWLPARGTTSWRVTGLPDPDRLTPAIYEIRARATDGADRVTTSPAQTFAKGYEGPADAVALLPAVGETANTSALAVNDSGLVAGLVGSVPSRGVVWAGDRPTSRPGPDGLGHSTVTAMAADGGSVGQTQVDSSGYRTWAVRWDADGTPHLLPDAEGAAYTSAAGVSAAGVVGSSGNAAVWWPDDKTVRVLPTLHAGESAKAADIDSAGTIVGSVTSPQGLSQAVVWTDGGRKVKPLGSLGGAGSQALAINDVGQAVGWARNAAGKTAPFITDVLDGDGMLEVYVPGAWGLANDVNDAGTVVGEYAVSPDVSAAFMSRGGLFTKLNARLASGTGWDLVRARSINNRGQIAGFGLKAGVGRGFLYSMPHAPITSDLSVTTDLDTPVAVTLAGHDPDPTSVLTYELTYPPSHGSFTSVLGGKPTYTPNAGWSGTDFFFYRAKDETGLWSSMATGYVTVRPGAPSNQKPVAVVTAPATVPEGSVVTLDGSTSSDQDGAVATYAWDLDEDGSYDDATGPTVQLTVPQQGTRVVGLKVVDDDGAAGTAVTSVVVTNVAPLVDLPATSTVEAGAPWVAAGSFADPGADTWSATVDTGSGPETIALSGKAFTVSTSFATVGTRTVTVKVCDGTECGSATTTVTVTPRPNKAPTAAIAAPASVAEGSAVQVDGSESSDDDGSLATYAWDLDGDGAYDDGAGVTASLTPEQQGQRTVGLRVVDDGGAVATTSRTLTVTNVAPVVTAGGSATAVVGQAWSIAGSFTDPGADTWDATVDLGDGLGAKAATVTGKQVTASGTFLAAGTRLVTVRVCDGTECGAATVTVTVTTAPTSSWPWDGFYSPVDNLPVVNTVKAGQAIPLKFSVGGYRGMDVFAAGYPRSVSHLCGSTAPTDAVEETVSPGSSELSYDAGTGRYQYVWKTQKPWAGQCRTLVMMLADGSVHSAEFQFR